MTIESGKETIDTKHRSHNHFPMGKTGYAPKFARLMRKREAKQ